MVEKFSEKEKAALTEKFEFRDSDKDGKLNRHDFLIIMVDLGLRDKFSPYEILETFDEADEDRDGLIDLATFLNMCADNKEILPDL